MSIHNQHNTAESCLTKGSLKIKQSLFIYLLGVIKNIFIKKPILSRCLLELTHNDLRVWSGHTLTDHPLDSINLTFAKHFLTTSVSASHKGTLLVAIHRFSTKACLDFSTEFNALRNGYINRKKVLDKVQKHKDEAMEVYQYFQSQFNADTYLTSRNATLLWSQLKSIQWVLKYYQTCEGLEASYKNLLTELSELATNFDERIKERNSQFEQRRLAENQLFFNHLEEHPLTEEQQAACLVDDNYNLILASAGSGKTSVIAGKAGLLIKNKEITEDEIIMLSFAKDASKEITDRVNNQLIKNDHEDFAWANNLSLKASTFHSLGRSIIIKSCKELRIEPPGIEAKDESANIADINNHLIEMLSDDSELALLIAYLSSYQKPGKSELDFETYEEMVEFLEDSDLKTLKGEKVKSHEEFVIANYLYLHNVDYVYEKPYAGDISCVGWNKTYHPDFTISQDGKIIYLEHFGVDENDQAPYFFKDREGYVESMNKKYQVHEFNDTCLLATKSYEYRNGVLEKRLRRRMENEGVIFCDRTSEEIVQTLRSHQAINDLASLISTFLNQFKASRMSLFELEEKMAQAAIEPRRAMAFFKVFSVVYQRYESNLQLRNRIDFNDMINKAIDYIKDGTYKSPYKRVLVDEFQDISKARLDLVNALIEHGPINTRGFFVGDDFQAIYAFTGCDIAFIKFFNEYFSEKAKIRSLYKTFRFNNKIGEIAKHFIEKNNFQHKKPIITHQKPLSYPTVSLVKTSEQAKLPITYSMGQIIEHSGLTENTDKEVSVLVLTRYRKDKDRAAKSENEAIFEPYRKKYPNLSIDLMTSHASKGQGEDYVIILDLYDGGFPCVKVNDPLLDIILTGDETFGKETYPYAEERRLFYVAMTRAKKRVYMVVTPPKISPFVRELLEDKLDIDVLEDTHSYDGSEVDLSISMSRCPRCKTGVLEKNKWGEHVCSHRTVCGAKFRTCPECEEGIVLPSDDPEFHQCSNCSKKFYSCGVCDSWLTVRTRKKDQHKFLGCVEFRQDRTGCHGTSANLAKEKQILASLNKKPINRARRK